jgi:hypothetical protein
MKRAALCDDGYLALKYEDLKRIGNNICAAQHGCGAASDSALRVFVWLGLLMAGNDRLLP